MKTANLVEIFYSLQGEGTLIGFPFLFVRFCECNLACRYCDTEISKSIQPFYNVIRNGEIIQKPNPVVLSDFIEILKGYTYHYLTYTGGEPLLQYRFIEDTLDYLDNKLILIETNATLPESVTPKLLNRIDYWSVDIKIPSVSDMQTIDMHREFLGRLSDAKNIIIKAVFSNHTSEEELIIAYEMAKSLYRKNSNTTMVFQPLTENGIIHLGGKIQTIYRMMEENAMPLKIIPQIHKIMNIP